MKIAYGYPNMDSDCISIDRDWLHQAWFSSHCEVRNIVREIISVQQSLHGGNCDASSMILACKQAASLRGYEPRPFPHLHSIHELIALPISHS